VIGGKGKMSKRRGRGRDLIPATLKEREKPRGGRKREGTDGSIAWWKDRKKKRKEQGGQKC